MIGFLGKIFSKRSGPVATGNLTDSDDFWFTVGGGSSSSGALVSKASAMRQWAVYACITEISQVLAQLPLKLKRPASSGGTENAEDHPLYDLAKYQPNPQMTSFNWREAQQANILATGNNYNFIERTRFAVKHIWPIDTTTVSPRKASRKDINDLRLARGDRIVYDVLTVDGLKTYPSKDILHIVGFGWNGLIGESTITNFAKESIGNAIILDQFQGKAMKNGYFPSGVFEHPNTLGDNKEAFVQALDNRFAGPENARRPMILENGMKFTVTNVSVADKQLIEQMKMSANQICGIFKVPPHRIAIFETNTNYNNTEQGNKSFLDGCIQQWVVRWEQAMNWKLLTAEERRAGYEFKFNFDALLRPDSKTRSEIQWREWQTGVPLNEIRKMNDQNPIEGGDVSFIPVNMIPASMAGMNIQAQADAAKKKADVDEGEAKNKLLDDDIDGLKRLEKKAIMREVERQIEGRSDRDFSAFLDEFYGKLFEKIDTRTRLILRCFNTDESTSAIIDGLKADFTASKELITELRERNFEGIEGIWP